MAIAKDIEEERRIWEFFKKEIPGAQKRTLKRALKQYKQQHGGYPKKIEIVDVPREPNDKILIVVGKILYLEYEPPARSRKNPHRYGHHFRNETLAISADGRRKYMFGKSQTREDGWIHG